MAGGETVWPEEKSSEAYDWRPGERRSRGVTKAVARTAGEKLAEGKLMAETNAAERGSVGAAYQSSGNQPRRQIILSARTTFTNVARKQKA